MQDIEFSSDGELAVVTLNRPLQNNLVTADMVCQLADIVEGFTGEIRVAILKAQGSTFCSGLDRGVDETIVSTWHRALKWWQRTDLVTIAAMQGVVIGVGFHLALACDLRFSSHNASFRIRENTPGVLAGFGGVQDLVARVGYARAFELCVSDRSLSAAEAERWGLLNAVVDETGLDDAASEMAGLMLTRDRDFLIETKSLLHGNSRMPFLHRGPAE
jgi:enoyl-CoA hydratase/carnithine racemase